MSAASTRRFICGRDDILDGGGVCALLDGEPSEGTLELNQNGAGALRDP